MSRCRLLLSQYGTGWSGFYYGLVRIRQHEKMRYCQVLFVLRLFCAVTGPIESQPHLCPLLVHLGSSHPVLDQSLVPVRALHPSLVPSLSLCPLLLFYVALLLSVDFVGVAPMVGSHQ